jgi:hypothetical protein
MNVISMIHEINVVANSVIGKPALPYLALPAKDSPEFMRVRTLDELNSSLNGHVDGRSQQQMNVFRHDDKRVQFIASLASMPIEGLQEESNVRFDNEQLPALPCREGHEVRSLWGDEPSRLQEQTSAAESRTSPLTVNRHEWNSCPSRWFLL